MNCAIRTLLVAASMAGSGVAHADNVIVLDSGEANVMLIDEQAHKVIDTYPTGKEPHHLMISPDGKSLLVANSVSNSLMIVDPATGRLKTTLTNIEDPYQLGFTPNGRWFVTNALRLDRVDVYHYDGGTFTLAKRIPLATMPSHMTFSMDNRTVFITLQASGELAAIDVPTQAVLWKMPVGKDPAGLWMVPGDRYLLVGMTGEDDVKVIDWRQQDVVKRIHTGRGAHNFRDLDDGVHVAVTNRVDNSISLINYRTLINDGDVTHLLPGPDDMELTADRKFLWVTFRFSRRVGVINLKDRKLENTIQVGRSPHGIFMADRAPVRSPNPD